MQFSGILTALVTPFQNGEVDEVSLKKLVHQQVTDGVDGLVVSGTTAESPVLSFAEKKRIFELVKAESGGNLPLLVGTGSNCTASSIELTQQAEKWGADGALVVVPYYNKPSQAGLVAHFTAVAKNTLLPVVLYNVPSRTVVSLSLESIVELSRIDNVVGIKEATGDAEFARQIVSETQGEFVVSSGDDGSFLRLMENGGHGIISVCSHVLLPQMKKWVRRVQEGDKSVHDDFAQYEKFLELLYCEPNPIPVKAALKQQGILATKEVRLPLVEMTADGQANLVEEMRKRELLS